MDLSAGSTLSRFIALLQNFMQAIRSSFTSCISAPKDEMQIFLDALSNAGIVGLIRKHQDADFQLYTVPWNLRCQPIPLAIVYARTAQDVSLSVKLAAQFGIKIQPRCGGHSYGSYSLGGTDGAVVIDLGEFNKVHVDTSSWQATIGGGTRLGTLTDELYKQGKRAIAHGVCPQVGIGGHATIGGQGPLSRMWGLSLDHIVDMEVVLADGTITRANKTQNPDLFWALRGAGASFGIITEFVVETHPTPETLTHFSVQITIGSAIDLANAFIKWQTFISTPAVLADRAFNSVVTITQSAVIIQGTRFGTQAELEASEIYVHLTDLGFETKVWELDWLASLIHWATGGLYTISGAVSLPLYIKNLMVPQSDLLDSTTVTKWFDYIHQHAGDDDSTLFIVVDFGGGRVNDFSNDETAYAHRDSLYTIAAYAIGSLPYPEKAIAFLNGMVDTIKAAQPDTKFGAYPGYVDLLLPNSEWPTQYWGANYPRLKQIKATYDPKNVFANPQSVGSD